MCGVSRCLACFAPSPAEALHPQESAAPYRVWCLQVSVCVGMARARSNADKETIRRRGLDGNGTVIMRCNHKMLWFVATEGTTSGALPGPRQCHSGLDGFPGVTRAGIARVSLRSSPEHPFAKRFRMVTKSAAQPGKRGRDWRGQTRVAARACSGGWARNGLSPGLVKRRPGNVG